MAAPDEYRLLSTFDLRPVFISLGLPPASFKATTDVRHTALFDAALNADSTRPDTVWLFKGSDYYAFNLRNGSFEGDVKQIAGNWGGNSWTPMPQLVNDRLASDDVRMQVMQFITRELTAVADHEGQMHALIQPDAQQLSVTLMPNPTSIVTTKGINHMADDVQVISGTTAQIAARLCNFETAQSYLLNTHVDWLDQNVQPIIHALTNPWVDIIGYASRIGDAEFNRKLSFQRCEAARKRIAEYSDRVLFNIEWAKGESESGPDEQNNDGYWRAADIYVYGAMPIPPPPSEPLLGSTHFLIRLIQGLSLSIPGTPAQTDYFMFQIVDQQQNLTAVFVYYALGLALPSLFPAIPVSLTSSGPFVSFTTTNPVQLTDLVGQAEVFQDPGAAFDGYSIGSLRLSIESELVLARHAGIQPSIIEIPTNQSIQAPGLGSATVGTLSMQGSVSPFSE